MPARLGAIRSLALSFEAPERVPAAASPRPVASAGRPPSSNLPRTGTGPLVLVTMLAALGLLALGAVRISARRRR